MKRLLCISILLCVVSCQRYDDTQIKKDISDLREQIASTDVLILFEIKDKHLAKAGDEIKLVLAPSVTKDTYAGLKAEIAGFDGEFVSVATKSDNSNCSWKIMAVNPEFGTDGKVTKNPYIAVLDAPSNATDAILTVTLIDNEGRNHVTSVVLTSEDNYADLVVMGKVFTSESDYPVEAFAVKDGKYIYVGSNAGVAGYIKEGVTTVIDHTGKGLVMPSCGNGHAHYLVGHAFKTIGTTIGGEDTPEKFLKTIVPAAVKKARDNNSSAIFGFGWNYHLFKDNMPTRQQLDAICAEIPMYFADEEGHKGLANTAALVAADIMDEDGKVRKKDDDIRGGEIVMGSNGEPTGLLLEQAGTYVRSFLDNDNLYTTEIASANLADIEKQLLAEGYTMYLDGWSNYFFNDNFYKASQKLDNEGNLHFILGLSHEIESWMTENDRVSIELGKATKSKDYASKHVLPQWIKLFIDGTVEGGTGYCAKPYPDGKTGIVNWTEDEVKDITGEANKNGLSMHIHTMGDMAVKLAVDAYDKGGKPEMRNTVVHVRNILPETLEKMAAHNITVTSGMLWHQAAWYLPIGMELLGMVPEGYADKPYPIKSFFDYGINVSSSTDYPALTGSPDSPFGVMGIAVSGMSDPSEQYPIWSQELISREQALKALTINCAKQMFIDGERGSIKKGKYADFLLVDRDVLSCDAHQIQYAKPAATYFEGKKVYPAAN